MTDFPIREGTIRVVAESVDPEFVRILTGDRRLGLPDPAHWWTVPVSSIEWKTQPREEPAMSEQPYTDYRREYRSQNEANVGMAGASLRRGDDVRDTWRTREEIFDMMRAAKGYFGPAVSSPMADAIERLINAFDAEIDELQRDRHEQRAVIQQLVATIDAREQEEGRLRRALFVLLDDLIGVYANDAGEGNDPAIPLQYNRIEDDALCSIAGAAATTIEPGTNETIAIHGWQQERILQDGIREYGQPFADLRSEPEKGDDDADPPGPRR